MNREGLYHLYKSILAEYGAIPPTEKQYEELINQLINIYIKKNESYPKEYI